MHRINHPTRITTPPIPLNHPLTRSLIHLTPLPLRHKPLLNLLTILNHPHSLTISPIPNLTLSTKNRQHQNKKHPKHFHNQQYTPTRLLLQIINVAQKAPA